jgi:hypothetical protein
VPAAVLSPEAQIYLIAYGDIFGLFDSRYRLRPLQTLSPFVACTVRSVAFDRRRGRRKLLKVQMRNKLAALEHLLQWAAVAPQSDEPRVH